MGLRNVGAAGLLHQMPAPGPYSMEPRPSRATGPTGGRSEGSGLPGLLLGDGERLLDLDLATVGDDHVLQGLVPAVCLGALHLPHHILPGTRDGRAGQGNLLGMRVSGWAASMARPSQT